jgi:hypothetical protein
MKGHVETKNADHQQKQIRLNKRERDSSDKNDGHAYCKNLPANQMQIMPVLNQLCKNGHEQT